MPGYAEACSCLRSALLARLAALGDGGDLGAHTRRSCWFSWPQGTGRRLSPLRRTCARPTGGQTFQGGEDVLGGRQATRVAGVISYSCGPCSGRGSLNWPSRQLSEHERCKPNASPTARRSGERARRVRARTGAARHLPPGSSSPRYRAHSWQMGWKARGPHRGRPPSPP